MKIKKIVALALSLALVLGLYNPVNSKAADSSLSLKGQVYTINATTTSTTIQWPNVVGASQYLISYADISKLSKDANGKYIGEYTNITVGAETTKYKIKGLGKASYYVTVAPIDASGLTGELGSTFVTPKKTKIVGILAETTGASAGDYSVKTGWNYPLAEGVQVQLVSAKGKVVQSKTLTDAEAESMNDTYTFYGVKRSSAYYVRVRGYNTFTGGEKKGQKYYGPWSTASKTSIFAPLPTITSQSKDVKKSSVKMKWKKVKGAVSYTVYGGKTKDSMKKKKTLKKTSYTIKGINTRGSAESGGYYVAVVANVKIKGKKKSSDKNCYIHAWTYVY